MTSGVSGGLLLALMTCVGPGDEVLIPDPYFVMYKHLVTLAGATAVYVDTYPDFAVTPERLAPYVTERTKLLLFNTPSNPTGVRASANECAAVAGFCAERDILLLSDEIYDVFAYGLEGTPFPSPLHGTADALLMRGFSKTYGMTGWRLGYVAGPKAVVEQMTKLQQYSFVCAPSMVQAAGVTALDTDMSAHVNGLRHQARPRGRTAEPALRTDRARRSLLRLPQGARAAGHDGQPVRRGRGGPEPAHHPRQRVQPARHPFPPELRLRRGDAGAGPGRAGGVGDGSEAPTRRGASPDEGLDAARAACLSFRPTTQPRYTRLSRVTEGRAL